MTSEIGENEELSVEPLTNIEGCFGWEIRDQIIERLAWVAMGAALWRLQLAPYAYTPLMRARITTVGDLVDHNADELLALPGFGAKSLEQVRLMLHAVGLHLQGEYRPPIAH